MFWRQEIQRNGAIATPNGAGAIANGTENIIFFLLPPREETQILHNMTKCAGTAYKVTIMNHDIQIMKKYCLKARNEIDIEHQYFITGTVQVTDYYARVNCSKNK